MKLNERRRSRPELGCSCFPKPHVFLSDRSQQAARGRPQIMRDRRHGNCTSSCLEVPRPMSRSLWPFRAMVKQIVPKGGSQISIVVLSSPTSNHPFASVAFFQEEVKLAFPPETSRSLASCSKCVSIPPPSFAPPSFASRHDRT